MAAINAYLTFNGNCEEAFELYKNVFGGSFEQMSRFKEMPGSENNHTAAEDAEKIMHVSFPINKETTLMGSDISKAFGQTFILGNNISLAVNAHSIEEADKIFKGLADGGTTTMPLADTFWGAYFGMCTDKFGVNWMVNHDAKPAN